MSGPCFCGEVRGVLSGLAIVLKGKRELDAFLWLCCGCLVLSFFLALVWVALQSVIVAFPGHTHFLFHID